MCQVCKLILSKIINIVDTQTPLVKLPHADFLAGS